MTNRRTAPDEKWGGINMADVGAGYKAATFAMAANHRLEMSKALERSRGIQRESRFMHGDSSFFHVVFKPRPAKPKTEAKKKLPMNADRPTRIQTQEFQKNLDTNIKQMSNFLLDEMSVKTLAIESAIDRANNISAIWLDSAMNAPRTFLRHKCELALNLRLTRFISDYFDLDTNERRLMLSEFERKTLL